MHDAQWWGAESLESQAIASGGPRANGRAEQLRKPHGTLVGLDIDAMHCIHSADYGEPKLAIPRIAAPCGSSMVIPVSTPGGSAGTPLNRRVAAEPVQQLLRQLNRRALSFAAHSDEVILLRSEVILLRSDMSSKQETYI